jgi:autotransporter family porin
LQKTGYFKKRKGERGMWIGTGANNFITRRVLMLAGKWVSDKNPISLLIMLLTLALATSASAEVIINSPSNGTTVSGTVTIKAYVNNAWWSKLWIDGGGGPTASIGNVTFQWNSGSVSNGSHVLTIDAYPSGQPANAADTITVVVNNGSGGGGGSSGHFGTLPSGASLPSDGTCAAEIPWEREMVPGNSGTNSTMPSQGQLDGYRANGYAAAVYGGGWAYARVDGQYTGNTDMIFRWAACKWGIDEDVVRAQATIEDWSWDQPQSGGDKRWSYSQCVNGGFTELWNYQCPSCCYQSWSIFQTKALNNWQSWPMVLNSTAFAADYHFASMRACMDGDLAGYFAGRSGNNGHTYSGDIASGNLSTIMWGCLGFHFSGDWYDGNSSSGAIWYIGQAQTALSQKSWKTRWPSVNWPD